ncbi:MAG: hypothetical protein WCS65_15950 [Verrucomicrobiae bacterium]
MRKSHKSQYTVRDIPEALDLRVREAAALEDTSLNQVVVRALERGLGLAEEPVRYRSLRHLIRPADKLDHKGWAEALGDMDKIHLEDWK